MTYLHIVKHAAIFLAGCFLLYTAFAYVLSAMGYHASNKQPSWRAFYGIMAVVCLLFGLSTCFYAYATL